jgi:hypothetical protein
MFFNSFVFTLFQPAILTIVNKCQIINIYWILGFKSYQNFHECINYFIQIH